MTTPSPTTKRFTNAETRARGLHVYTQRDLRNMSVSRETTARTKTGEYRQGRYGERYIDVRGMSRTQKLSILYAIANTTTPRWVQVRYASHGIIRTNEGFSTVGVNESTLRAITDDEFTSGTPGTDGFDSFSPDEIETIIYAPFTRVHHR